MLRLQNIRQLFKMHGIDTGEKEEEKQRKKMERAARKKQKLRESVEEILREERLRRGRDDSG